MQVALNGFAGSFLLVWLYGRVVRLWPAWTRRETGLVPFVLFLGLATRFGVTGQLVDHGLLSACGLVFAWGLLLEGTGRGSSKAMVLGDLLGVAALVGRGLQVDFLSAPAGGYIYLAGWTGPLTCLWLLAFVVLLKLANRLPGLFPGVMALLSYLLMGSMLYQQQHPVGAFRLVALLSGVATAMWLNGLGGSGGRMGRVAVSLWSLTLGALTVLSTSKKVATLAVLSPVGLGLAPLFFFSFVIMRSYLWPRISAKGARPTVLRVALSEQRLVGVLLLFSLLINLYLLMWLFVPSRLWSAGLALAMGVVFFEVMQLVLMPGDLPAAPAPPQVDLLGIRFLRRTRAEHVEQARDWLRSPGTRTVVTPDSLAVLRAQEDPEYRAVVTAADMRLPDGAGVIWATDFLTGRPMLEQVPGVEFVGELCRLAAEEGAPVFLLGSKQAVLEKAAVALGARYPGLKVAGWHDGYFDPEFSPDVAREIRASGAKIVLVAMGVPKQELWIRDWGHATGARILIGVGGSLDVLSGTLERAPRWFQLSGLEWLYRTLKEPHRLLRARRLPAFVLAVLVAKLQASSPRR